MSTAKTYQGSCNCKRVRFELTVDLSQGTFKCNCTRCMKGRLWAVSVKPDAVRLLSGEGELTRYAPGTIEGLFCRHCGVGLGGRGDLPQAGGAFFAVNLGTLDDLPPEELAAAPVSYLDGRNDRWDRTPAFIGHL